MVGCLREWVGEMFIGVSQDAQRLGPNRAGHALGFGRYSASRVEHAERALRVLSVPPRSETMSIRVLQDPEHVKVIRATASPGSIAMESSVQALQGRDSLWSPQTTALALSQRPSGA